MSVAFSCCKKNRYAGDVSGRQSIQMHSETTIYMCWKCV